MSLDDVTPRPADGTYWASLTGDSLAVQIVARLREYQRELQARRIYNLWDAITLTYYGYDPGTDAVSTEIIPKGEMGEYLGIHVNQFRSFLAHQLALTTGDALKFDCMASNNSPESEAQATLGNALLEHYETKVGAENVAPQRVRQCERMLLFGAGYMVKLWDATVGPDAGTHDVPVLDPHTGEPVMEIEPSLSYGGVPPGSEEPMTPTSDTETMHIPAPPSGMQEQPQPLVPQQRPKLETKIRKAGDIVTKVYGPQDVARDLGARDHTAVRWYVVRERWDKHELAARFPEHAEFIRARPIFYNDETTKWQTVQTSFQLRSDQIHVLRLLHDRCPQMPDGLEALVCGDRLLGPALPLAYPRLPVHVMVADEYLDRAMGYPPCMNLLGLQAAHNSAWISAISRADAGALPKWAISRKANISHRKLASDAMVVEYDVDPQAPNAGLPTLMDVPGITEADLKLMEQTEAAMESTSGVNAVVRGKSEGKSGADNALIQAQAVQSQSRFMQAYVASARSDALGTIELFQTFADEERTISVIGEDEAPTIEYVSKDSIRAVKGVEVEQGDPVTRTAAGRLSLANNLAERFPQQVDAERFMEVVSTGRLEPIWRAQQNEVRLIRAENVALAKGNPPAPGAQPMMAPDPQTGQVAPVPPRGQVQAAICDNHMAHIREHLSLLSSPSLRSNQQLTTAVLAHVQEHEMLWMQLLARPALLAATGQPPPPIPGGMPGPGGPSPGAPASDAPGSEAQGQKPKPDQASVAGADVGGMPRAPKNPANGQPAQINQGPQ